MLKNGKICGSSTQTIYNFHYIVTYHIIIWGCTFYSDNYAEISRVRPIVSSPWCKGYSVKCRVPQGVLNCYKFGNHYFRVPKPKVPHIYSIPFHYSKVPFHLFNFIANKQLTASWFCKKNTTVFKVFVEAFPTIQLKVHCFQVLCF